MSYPGAPGVPKNQSQPSSLPPRPPTSKLPSGFKPAFAAAPSYSSNAAPSYQAATTYGAPPSVYGAAPQQSSYGAPPSAASYGSYGAPSVGVGGYGQAAGAYNNYSQSAQPQQQQTTYYNAVPPQIRNPFPAPGAQGQGAELDPEAAAQIAQWQSAYMPKESGDHSSRYTRPATTSGHPGAGNATAPDTGATEPASTSDKKLTVVREGGGKKWRDDTLVEWDPAHLRLFVGNLAGETTDDSLLKAFARWKSVQKAKVIRDQRSTKSKGYGFVSFSDPDDFFQAAKEMNGKYIQSHPVVVHKAKTEIRPQVVREDDHRRKRGGKQKKGKQSGNGMGKADGGGGYEPSLGPAHNGGVTKPGQKTRGGLKLLG